MSGSGIGNEAMKPDRLLAQEKGAFPSIKAPCPYFGSCGGCTLQDLAYTDQLAFKQQRLLKLLGPLDPSLTLEVVGLNDPWRYRNKAEFTFSGTSEELTLGFHASRSFWRIVDIEACLLLPDSVSEVLRDAKALARATGLPAYNPRSHQGFFRYLLVRASHATGRLLACLVTTAGNRPLIEQVAETLMARHPALESFYWGVNEKVADIAVPDELVHVRGRPYLHDRIGPFTLQVHPLSFLQPTPAQAERMYATMLEWVNGIPSGVAWDLYCGIGLVGFYLASAFRTVYGIDVDAQNLEMARLNAAANGITNMEFHLGRAEDVLLNKRFWLTDAKPDVVVVDPPRSGLHARVVASLLDARPKQIVCFSCNVQTLVRDLQLLLTGFPRYRLRRVRAFDLFPHTAHVEVLTLLERA